MKKVVGFIEKNKKYMPVTIKGFLSGILGIGSLFAFLFQELVGIVLSSTVWICAGVYSLCTAGARGIFSLSQRRGVSERGKAKHAIFVAVIMLVADIAFCVLTNLRVLNSNIVRLPWFVVFLLISFSSYSLLKLLLLLLRIKWKKDPSFFAYRIVGVSGMLKNFVLLQRLILSCLPLTDEKILSVNTSFGYFIGGTLILLAVWLLCRSIKKLKTLPKDPKIREEKHLRDLEGMREVEEE